MTDSPSDKRAAMRGIVPLFIVSNYGPLSDPRVMTLALSPGRRERTESATERNEPGADLADGAVSLRKSAIVL